MPDSKLTDAPNASIGLITVPALADRLYSERAGVSQAITLGNLIQNIPTISLVNGFSAPAASPTFAGLTVDSPTLFVDSVNHRVGVGTTGPASKLHIVDATTSYGSDLGNIIISNSVTPTKRLALGFDTSLGASGSSFIQSVNSGVQALSLLLNANGGNVGIGLTGPTFVLDVSGTVRLGAAAGTSGVTIDGTGFGAGVASLRFNGLTTAAVNNLVGTLTNSPVTGNPTFWMPINIAGVVRYCPLW